MDRGFFILTDGKAALYRLVRVSLPACQAAGADFGAGEVMEGLEAGLRLLCTEGGRQITREDESRISASLDEEFGALLIEEMLPEAHRRAARQQPGWYLPDGWPTSVSLSHSLPTLLSEHFPRQQDIQTVSDLCVLLFPLPCRLAAQQQTTGQQTGLATKQQTTGQTTQQAVAMQAMWR